jgi:hypothetical protein
MDLKLDIIDTAHLELFYYRQSLPSRSIIKMANPGGPNMRVEERVPAGSLPVAYLVVLGRVDGGFARRGAAAAFWNVIQNFTRTHGFYDIN